MSFPHVSFPHVSFPHAAASRLLCALLIAAWVPAGAHADTGAAAASDRRVLIERTVEPSDPYVQAAVIVTVRAFSSRPLYHTELDLPPSDAAVVHQVGADEHGSVRRNGRLFALLTRHYLVFPQRSGRLRLPGPMLSAQMMLAQDGPDPFGTDPLASFFGASPFGGLVAGASALRLQASDITLDVRPRPPGTVGSYWLPARRIDLKSTWHPDQLQVRVGDPLTITLSLSAEGLTAEQLPDLSQLQSLPSGVRAYPDAARLANGTQEGTLVGSREQSIALIAQSPGRFTLPALHVRWWDTSADVVRETVLPARTLSILPSLTAGAAATASASPHEAHALRAANDAHASHAESSSPWPWISLLFAVLWLATLAAWLTSGQRLTRGAEPGTAPKPDIARARAAFRRACRNGAAVEARRELLAWMAGAWPHTAAPGVHRITPGVNALARLTPDPKLKLLLRELERACYVGGAWRGSALAEALVELPTPPGSSRSGARRTGELAPLYR